MKNQRRGEATTNTYARDSEDLLAGLLDFQELLGFLQEFIFLNGQHTSASTKIVCLEDFLFMDNLIVNEIRTIFHSEVSLV